MIETTSHPSRDQLAAFDLGRLSPAEWSAIKEHVAGCDACCRQLEGVTPDPLVRLMQAAAGSRVSDTGPGGSVETPPPVASGAVDVPASLLNHPRYRVLDSLGAGGMGTVFKAEHRLMERLVALKVIRKELMDQPETIERFRQEVKAAAKLSHPNIVT